MYACNYDKHEKNKTVFHCALCRYPIDKSFLYITIDTIIKNKILDFINIYKEILGVSDRRYKTILARLLINNGGSLDKLNDLLFNMSGLLVQQQSLPVNITSQDKQELYLAYRAPVDAIRAQIESVKAEICKNSTPELCSQLKALYIDLEEAKKKSCAQYLQQYKFSDFYEWLR